MVEALVKTNSNFDTDYKFYFQNIGLNNLITYQIKEENGLITTTVNGSNQTINVFATDPDWATNGLYFKAGSYCQDNVGATNAVARLAFYALSRSHAPSITNQPTARSVGAGSNATFSVSATGSGLLRYQWRFNDTNEVAAQFAALTWSAPLNPPTLNIERAGDNIVLSWSTNGTAGYDLWSTPSLSSAVWMPTGTPTIVGNENRVTNAMTGDAQYYRLEKP